jgi:hypothetical protein
LSVTVALGLLLSGGRVVRAQFGFGGTPGYPNIGQFGAAPQTTYSGFGGFGSGYGVASGGGGYGGAVGYGFTPTYGVSTGLPYGVPNTGYNPLAGIGQPQTRTELQPLYNAITSVPGWSPGATPPRRGAVRARHRAQPTVPRSQMMTDDGTILWPSATPNDATVSDSRKAVESAVKDVVKLEKMYGHAPTRSVIDAKVKLAKFMKAAVPPLKTKNHADGAGLEVFMNELGKTLETMALNY